MMQHFVTSAPVDLTTKSIGDAQGIIVLVSLFAVAICCGWFLREEFHQSHVK